MFLLDSSPEKFFIENDLAKCFGRDFHIFRVGFESMSNLFESEDGNINHLRAKAISRELMTLLRLQRGSF